MVTVPTFRAVRTNAHHRFDVPVLSRRRRARACLGRRRERNVPSV
jgi:hypothetical protein